MGVVYANGPCRRCNVPVHDPADRLVSANRHAVNVIPSTPVSEQLARAYQAKLWHDMDDAVHRHLDAEQTTGQFMLGALLAFFESAPGQKLGGLTRSYLAVSGFGRDTGRAEHAANQLDAVFADETNCEQQNGGHFYTDVFGEQARLRPGGLTGQQLPGIGSCAAPKLLLALIRDAGASGLRVARLEMTEVFVVASNIAGRDRNKTYARVDVAPSCDKCVILLPQILCNLCKTGEKNGKSTQQGGQFHPKILAHQLVEKL